MNDHSLNALNNDDLLTVCHLLEKNLSFETTAGRLRYLADYLEKMNDEEKLSALIYVKKFPHVLDALRNRHECQLLHGNIHLERIILLLKNINENLNTLIDKNLDCVD